VRLAVWTVSFTLIGYLAIFQGYYNRLADVLKAINDYYESRGAAV